MKSVDKRFFFAYLDEGISGTIIIYDDLNPKPSDDCVYLYHAKKKKILKFKKIVVRGKLKPLSDEHFSVLSYVHSQYFSARKMLFDNIADDKYKEKQQLMPNGYCFYCEGSGREFIDKSIIKDLLHEGVNEESIGIACSFCGGTGIEGEGVVIL